MNGFFNFNESNLLNFQKLQYNSISHSFNKSVIAAYYNVKKYGFEQYVWGIAIKQSKRTVNFCTNKDMLIADVDSKSIFLSEQAIFKKKEKEVCYALDDLFAVPTSVINRGIKFVDRDSVAIVDYKKDDRLDYLYNNWKQTKESIPTTFLMTFNPARYYRSYELLDFGYNIYQKIVLVKNQPYAVINFAIQDDIAFELSFLSLFKNQELKLINDQNDCIIIHCLYDLYKNYNIKTVNLGTDAGIKGLKFFKHKLPNFEQIVYRS